MGAADVFVGPAIVVDDTYRSAECTMQPIIDQIEKRGLPLLGLTELPSVEQIRHWRRFSLIVLDWELGGQDASVAGVAMPAELKASREREVAGFIAALVKELVCPLFVFSNEDVNMITGKIAEAMKWDRDRVQERIMVRSKTVMEKDLFAEVGTWVERRSALYALQRWDVGYEEAKTQMFQDLADASPTWPKVLWRTAGKDSVNPHGELVETLSRNLLHRMKPILFEERLFEMQDGDPKDTPEVLRKVIHRQAVVPGWSLRADTVMPGDLFGAGEGDAGSPSDAAGEVWINVTPACDLVPRQGEKLDDVRLVVLVARRVEDPEKFRKLLDNEMKFDPVHLQILHVLSETGAPYRVQFKEWRLTRWGDVASRRSGRLLEPYITQLQQKFALHFHRQGLPRLPDEFFGGQN